MNSRPVFYVNGILLIFLIMGDFFLYNKIQIR